MRKQMLRKQLPKKVFVQGSKSNISLVSILREKPPLNEVDFKVLPESNEPLVRSIEQINERSILMWESGGNHHLSHHFNLRNGRVRKRILDNHDDYFDWYPDFIGKDKKGLSYSNHVYFTDQLDNYSVELVLTNERLKILNEASQCSSSVSEGEEDPLSFLHGRYFDIHYIKRKSGEALEKIINRSNSQYGQQNKHDKLNQQGQTSAISQPINQYVVPYFLEEDELLHLSIDLDCIPNLLVMKCFQTKDGFSLEEILQTLKDALETGKLERIDFGGVAHDFHKAVKLREKNRIFRNLTGESFELTIQTYYSILKLSMFGS